MRSDAELIIPLLRPSTTPLLHHPLTLRPPSVVRAFRCRRHDVHPAAVLVEGDFAIDQREESPIASGPDVGAGIKLRAALADEDAARGDELPAVTFHSQPFAGAVAAVPDAALTFFVCHNSIL